MKGRIINIIIDFFKENWKILLIWTVIVLIVIIGILLHIDKDIIAAFTIVFGVISSAFSGLVALISTIPIIGPIIAKVLSLPILWVMNAIGYFISAFAIKRGYKKNVLNHRILTIIFLFGFTIGFIFAKLI